MSPKQQQFCEEFIACNCNATRAYAKVYGCTEAAARASAAVLLAKPSISTYIQDLQRQRQQRTEITSDRVVQELAAIAFARITDVVTFNDDDGVTCHNSAELSQQTQSAIAEISIVKTVRSTKQGDEITTNVKLKMHNKLAALTQLVRLMGLDLEGAIASVARAGYTIINPTTNEPITPSFEMGAIGSDDGDGE